MLTVKNRFEIVYNLKNPPNRVHFLEEDIYFNKKQVKFNYFAASVHCFRAILSGRIWYEKTGFAPFFAILFTLYPRIGTSGTFSIVKMHCFDLDITDTS